MNRHIAFLVGPCAFALAFAASCDSRTNGAVGYARNRRAISSPATSTTDASTTTGSSTTTAVVPATTVTVGPVATPQLPQLPPPATSGETEPATPADLRAVLAVEGTTLRIHTQTPYTLEVQNIADHPVSLPAQLAFGISIDSVSSGAWSFGTGSQPQSTLAPGEQRRFDGSVLPDPRMIGAVRVSAAIVFDGGVFCRCQPSRQYIPGTPAISMEIIPPGWSAGQPLDPAQGKWDAALSADTTRVAVGDWLTLRTTMTNTGTEPQRTVAFNALAVACGREPASAETAHVIGRATVAPGARTTLSTRLRLHFLPGRISCWIGVQTHGYGPVTLPLHGLPPHPIMITVIPAPTPTSTTTTTTLSPHGT